MLHNGEVTVTEAKRMLRGYWWILPLAVVLCGASGFGVATVMPKRYTSQTTLLIDDSTLPNDYVKADNDLNRRLASMQSQIMSRASLQPIIDKLGLYAGERQRLRVEDLVQRLAAAITVKPLESTPGTQNQSLPGFNLSVNFNDPRIAQQICNEITSMLMQHNAREREQHAAQATSFLSEQLKSAKHKLAAPKPRHGSAATNKGLLPRAGGGEPRSVGASDVRAFAGRAEMTKRKGKNPHG